MINENKLSEKWWWRALKVTYILIWVFSIGSLGLLAWTSDRPQSYTSYTELDIKCPNGKQYTHKLTIPEGIKDEETKVWNRVCIGNISEANSTIPVFKWNRTEIKHGSWGAILKTLVVGFLIIFGIIEVIKTIVLYIMGISVWRGVLLYSTEILLLFSSNKQNKN